ncbi:glyoxylate/hydroxypyruvate reductase A [Fodinicurvata sp. EGI_FJ10296]|uniref:2-hydroxyacid dehydrogenase n=1 Tax=Fodinicurvata sp. EGI_FJ10296 TaxID=3231908 RepID=UPI0034570DE8
MTLLFASSDKEDTESWVPALRSTLTDREVRAYPDIGREDDIDYALVWKPEPGLLARLPNLKVIFSMGAGVDAVLKDETLPTHIPLVRMVDDSLTEGMTEYVVLHALRIHRQLEAYRAQQAQHLWNQLPERLGRERPVGVMGLGVLGSDAATMLSRLRFDVAGWSRSPKSVDGVTSFHGEEGLDAFLRRTEILVNLLPLTAETTGILNADTLRRLPRGAHVINVARGLHVVDADLLAALDDEHIASATLDVFSTEPLPADHPYWSHPAVTMTPHVASVTHARTAIRTVMENIRRFEAGEPLQNVVDRGRGY